MKENATEFKFDDVYDCCHFLNGSIMCATEVLIAARIRGRGQELLFRFP